MNTKGDESALKKARLFSIAGTIAVATTIGIILLQASTGN